MTTFLLNNGFTQNYANTSLLTYKKGKDFLALVIYVDDILLTGNNQDLINHFKHQLDQAFSIKDLGSLNYYLGIEFLRSLKASFGTNYNEKFELLKKIPLLLLDDIGAENCSNWSRDEVLGPILQYRMDNHLPTFFTSNLTLEELEASLATTSSGVDKLKARRIIERIKQLTVQLELVSKNRRG